MQIYGYEVDDGTGDEWEWVLLNAPLLLDAARFERSSWEQAQKLCPILKGRSRKGLSKLLQAIDEDVRLAYADLQSGNVEVAQTRLLSYGIPTVGVFDAEAFKDAIRLVEAYQESDSRAGAYECHEIISGMLYLCVWIDR